MLAHCLSYGTYGRGHESNTDKLREEVSNGECDIGLVGKEVMRTVFVIALHIKQGNNLQLIARSSTLTPRSTHSQRDRQRSVGGGYVPPYRLALGRITDWLMPEPEPVMIP